MNETPDKPGWYPDPTGKHEYRWHDEHGWSGIVRDGEKIRAFPVPLVRERAVPPDCWRRRMLRMLIGAVAVAVVFGAFLLYVNWITD